MKRYQVVVSQPGGGVEEHSADTIAEGRQIAEGYGTTANEARIYDRRDRLMARHRRSPEGDGSTWYKATV